MKFCFYTDPHWSQNSSIIRSRGEEYSTRLENLIKSLNWVEELAWNTGCTAIICGGDFFDSSQLNSEEASALHKINWSPIGHIFITGNHESNVSTLEYSLTNIFKLCPNAVVFNQPAYYNIEGTDVQFCFLPYILERDRKTINEYFPIRAGEKRIIFSHNDLKDVQYGPFKSTEGFALDDIEANCDLMLNGHIHHCQYITPKIINGGNLTGQNFTEDAYKFEHTVQIVDTDTMHVDFYKNPYAFNFYKVDCTKMDTMEEIQNELYSLRDFAVITLKVKSKLATQVKEFISTAPKDRIVEYRVTVEPDISDTTLVEDIGIETVDHLKQFENYVLSNIGTSDIVKEELMNVMR